jgi:hypothetical protein
MRLVDPQAPADDGDQPEQLDRPGGRPDPDNDGRRIVLDDVDDNVIPRPRLHKNIRESRRGNKARVLS